MRDLMLGSKAPLLLQCGEENTHDVNFSIRSLFKI